MTDSNDAPEQDHKRRVADQAYDALESMIATLVLKPGAPIVEAELIERTGLGRTPTREALMRLVSNGLIVQLPRRGLRVSDIWLAEHLDLVEARRVLERLIAATSARRATPAQREDLLACARSMVKAGEDDDLAAYMDADQALDRVNHAACRNPFAVAAVVPMVIQCRRFWYAYQHQGDIKEGARRHLLLAQAIAGGDGEQAAQASDALMDYLRQFAQAVIE
ncbi:GntR family transcriptional regulator [Paucibacter sp. O1-1]|uniref:GntR family transcriptional regulator n=1 Tax=Paucibacter sp. M5-1 TaxID=3015998 RepID=UPI0010F99A13|nr:GntR family transcriptional regulator [Paucibacter sp. M5-1]MCU7373870.1 GntR family transcriptional regulator [Paucibacter sp. O1-1]MCZ7880176.1 GntR family transcriptional regulator [Paucibacter sp. M5-1]MDA3828872.1 GntR family transcriptional regulator [Paucibacter sp. O1-1]